MARTKTTSPNPEIQTALMARPNPPPPPNDVADQTSDQTPLNETPLRIILSDIIIPCSEPHKRSKPSKPSKPKSSKSQTKKPIIKPKATRRSQRVISGAGSSSNKKTIVSHVDLSTDEEKEEDSEESLSEMIKSVKKAKKVATPSQSEEKPPSPSQQEEEKVEEEKKLHLRNMEKARILQRLPPW